MSSKDFSFLSEDVAGQSEEENHSVDAKDGEDIPSGTGPIQKLQGPGGVAAVSSSMWSPSRCPRTGPAWVCWGLPIPYETDVHVRPTFWG